MALQYPTFPGSGGGGGGGGGPTGIARGWTYLAKADATYVPRNNSGVSPTALVSASSDDGTNWSISHQATHQSTDLTGSGLATSQLGNGSHWYWPLPDSATVGDSWTIHFRLDLLTFGTANKHDRIVIGLADVGDGTELNDTSIGRASFGGFANDFSVDGGGLIRPDILYGHGTGTHVGSISAYQASGSGEVSTVIVSVVKHSSDVVACAVSSYRRTPSGGAAKKAATFTKTGAVTYSANMKIFIQVGRIGSTNADTTLTFKPYYQMSTSKSETDFGI